MRNKKSLKFLKIQAADFDIIELVEHVVALFVIVKFQRTAITQYKPWQRFSKLFQRKRLQ